MAGRLSPLPATDTFSQAASGHAVGRGCRERRQRSMSRDQRIQLAVILVCCALVVVSVAAIKLAK
jgi:hypothetical protein